MVITGMLKLHGCAPLVVGNGIEAVAACARERFDPVFLYCQMPEMDGFAAARAIRANEARRGIVRVPIIALTANALAGDREACIAAGMDDYLAKPLRQELVAGKLERLRVVGPARKPAISLL